MLFSKLGTRTAFTYGRMGALMMLALIATVAFYSPSSASLDKNKAGGSQAAAGSLDPLRAIIAPGRFGTFSSSFMPPAPPSPEGLATYDSTCTTPKTTFNLGETVCLKTTDVPVDSSRSVTWSNPISQELQRTDLVSSPDDSFMLPATQTSVVDGLVVDNRGTWTVKVVLAGRSKVRAAATFTVKDPDNPAFDLNVYSAADTAEGSVPADTDLTVLTTVSNFGPNDAAGVELVQAVPSNATFMSGGQTSTGPPNFSCLNPAMGGVGASNCTIASLPAGSSADFTFVYHINPSVPAGTSINSLATVTPDTTVDGELHTPDNAWTARARVTENPNASTCAVGCPANITVSAASPSGTIVNFAGDIESSGSCGTITASPASGTMFPVGTTNVNVSTTQGASCSFTVTVTNSAAPTITCAADQMAVAPSGQTETSVTVNAPTATGTNVTISAVRNDNRGVSDPYPVGTTTITWTATECLDSPDCADPNARTASCMQHIVVTAPDAPTISCPSDKSFNQDSCQPLALTSGQIGMPMTTGSNVTVQGTRSDSQDLYADPYPIGTTFITWTATDDIGRVVSCTQRITVVAIGDTEAPMITAPPNVSVTTSSCGQIVGETQLGAPTSSDNCGIVNVVRTGVPPGNFFPTGTTTITYTATDSAGNMATATQTVTVTESPAIPPTFTFVPADLTVNTGPGATTCGKFVGDATLGTATAQDNCPGVTVTRSGVPAGNNFPVGDTTITYTATDRSGNTATATQKVTVIDNTVPVVTPPTNVTAYTGAGATSCGTVVSDATLGTATASDNCPGVGAVTRTGVPAGNAFPVGNTTVTYSVIDAHGNSSSATQTVTVIDNTPPTITCPSNIVLEPTCPTGAKATWTAPVGTDNCPGAVTTQTAGPASGSTFPIGTTTVTYTTNDAHGNSTSCSFTVTVKTAAQTVQNMITAVQAITPPLSGQQSQGLVAKLQAALDAINQGKTNVACNKLGDFINQVTAYIGNGTLSVAQGQPLIASANKVRNTIGCTSLPCS